MPPGHKHITSVLEDDQEARDFIYGGKKIESQPPSHLQRNERFLFASLLS